MLCNKKSIDRSKLQKRIILERELFTRSSNIEIRFFKTKNKAFNCSARKINDKNKKDFLFKKIFFFQLQFVEIFEKKKVVLS